MFDVIGHPQAKRAYAWIRATADERRPRFDAVLELPPVDSPSLAVQMAVLVEAALSEVKAKD